MSKEKTCGDCRHFDGRYNLCAVTSDFCTVEPDYSACDDFEQKPKPTNACLSESAFRVIDLNCSFIGEILSQLANEDRILYCSSEERSMKLMGSISRILM